MLESREWDDSILLYGTVWMEAEALKTILLVEDEATIALAESMMLKRNGYAVCTAYSGSTAVEAVRKAEDIDLVLMDLDLGSGMDGAETAEKILVERTLPVLFLSSHTEQEVVERTERIASYGYVVKNSGDEVLLASIKMAFKLFEARQKYQTKAVELETANARLKEALAERERIDKALVASEAEFRSIFDAAPAGIAMLESRIFRKVNMAMLQIFGYSEGEMLGKTTRILYCDDEEYGRVGRELYGALLGRRSVVIETRLRTKDGAILDILIGASALDPVSADPMSSVACVLFDVTDKRRIQDSLRGKERFLAGLFRACPECLSLTTLDDGRFIEANEAAFRQLGYSREELIGRSVDELGIWFKPSDRAKAIEQFREDGLVRNFEAKQRMKDGSVIDALVSMSKIEIEGRMCLLSFVTDISEQKRIEIALGESLREKDVLFHELQHRIKNGLAMIASMIDLEAGRAEGPRMAEVLGNLKDRVGSMSALYDLFAASGTTGSVDLREYLGAIIDSLSEAYSGAHERIRIERDIESMRTDVKSALSWGLLVNELVTNALKHAFPGNAEGSIRIELSYSDGRIDLAVSDNGIGLPETFELERSGGLGLDIARMMSAQLGGTLSVDRSRGTAFVVSVPR
jgi:two-component system, sensor histidine kinase PdtaS